MGDVAHADGPIATLLDVREAWEVQAASVVGSPGLPAGFRWLHIPMRDLPSHLAQLNPDEPLAVLCHHGTRSLHVGQWLSQHGFEVLANVQGGIDAWARDFDPSIATY